MRFKTWFVAVALLTGVTNAGAQQQSSRPWAVWKLGNGTAQIVASFDSEQEAGADEARRNRFNPKPKAFCHVVRKEKLTLDDTAPAYPSLQGRSGEGTMGSYTFKVHFYSKDFILVGDLKGKGKWRQTRDGAITLDTSAFLYLGIWEGDLLHGWRILKFGNKPQQVRWSVRLEPSKFAGLPGKPKTKTPGKIGGHDDDGEIHQITADEIKAFAGEKKKAVVGVLPKKDGIGNVVTAVPGSNNRIWDSNTLGGFKDLADGKKITDDKVVDRMGKFIQEQDPKKAHEIQESAENLRAKLLDLGEEPREVENKVARQVREKIKEQLDQSTPQERKAYFDLYAERGAPIVHLIRPAELDQIQWYQVPAQNDIRVIVREYQPPPFSPPSITSPPPITPLPPEKTVNDTGSSQRLVARDVDLLGKISPRYRFGYDDSLPKTPALPNPRPTPRPQPLIITNPVGTVNSISSIFKKQAQQTQKVQQLQIQRTRPVPIVRPPEPTRAPIFQPQPRERKVNTKPGGVIITAVAQIEGLDPKYVSRATFDVTNGTLTFSRRSGGAVSIRLNADDFAIAVRSVFEKKVDPSLSMSFGEMKGYKSVDYCGPLFKTRFGKVMYQADELLGSIIFNREGSHRAVAGNIIPRYEEMACEASQTSTFGSRVFLRASEARFTVKKNRLIFRDIKTKVDVEGTGYAADYYQESLHRLARAMDAKFDALTAQFDDFQEFRGLVGCVALAKWVQKNAIPFDWQSLKNRKVAQVEVPALVPAAEWSTLFNGRNLNGWRLNLTTDEIEWSLENGALTLKPTGQEPVNLLASNYWPGYDLRYTVVTKGPVDFILRNGPDDQGASVTIDTRGRPQKIELFVTDRKWTAVAPGLAEEGELNVPEPKKGEVRQPNEIGIRVPSGSSLTLYTAALRGRQLP